MKVQAPLTRPTVVESLEKSCGSYAELLKKLNVRKFHYADGSFIHTMLSAFITADRSTCSNNSKISALLPLQPSKTVSICRPYGQVGTTMIMKSGKVETRLKIVFHAQGVFHACWCCYVSE